MRRNRAATKDKCMSYFPTTEAELASLIASQESPLFIHGGATRLARPHDGTPLSVTGISGIVDYEPGALTMVARAGTPVAEIETALAAENQQLAFEPVSLGAILGRAGNSTIGGVFATNASGSRRIQAGAARDFLLGVRFVDGTGTIVKNGGRVMKNVTGYDLVKLMAGSYGTLGVMTEVAFKVLPIAETIGTLAITVSDAAQATRVMTQALNTPFDVTGAAYDPAQARAYIRVEGFEGSVTYRTGALRDALGQFGDVDLLDTQASHALWQGLRDVAPLQGQNGDLWRVSVKPTDGPAVVAAAQPTAYVMDWSGGLVWMRVPVGTDVRAALSGIDGHATCVIGDAPKFHPEPAGVAAITAAIRAKYDPKGILNTGMMG